MRGNKLNRLFSFFSSLQFSIVIFISLIILLSIGTFIESTYSARFASKLVYQSIWMHFICALLVINLTMAMFIRWPWKKQHVPFLFAHIGIIVLVFGAFLTSYKGFDGVIKIKIGDRAQRVTLPEAEIKIFSAYDGVNYTTLFNKTVDFILNPIRPDSPVKILFGDDHIELVEFLPLKGSVEALKVRFDQKEYWMPLNSMLKFFKDQWIYIFTYGNKRFDLGFDLTLDDFIIERYPGVQKAKSYKSIVQLPDHKKVILSMNDPLKIQGFTFYQSSFEEDDNGKPVASILSVNYDPGRVAKYFGSILIAIGLILLIFKKKFFSPKRVH